MPFKISVLVFVRNTDGKLLLLRRAKSPNMGLLSPIGGKLEMQTGESPFEAAVRETREEIGLETTPADHHLFAMISERGYENNCHWLMFLFDCKKRIPTLPPDMREGKFGFYDFSDIKSGKIKNIPDTDRLILWDIWSKNAEGGFSAISADCNRTISYTIQENIPQ